MHCLPRLTDFLVMHQRTYHHPCSTGLAALPKKEMKSIWNYLFLSAPACSEASPWNNLEQSCQGHQPTLSRNYLLPYLKTPLPVSRLSVLMSQFLWAGNFLKESSHTYILCVKWIPSLPLPSCSSPCTASIFPSVPLYSSICSWFSISV